MVAFSLTLCRTTASTRFLHRNIFPLAFSRRIKTSRFRAKPPLAPLIGHLLSSITFPHGLIFWIGHICNLFSISLPRDKVVSRKLWNDALDGTGPISYLFFCLFFFPSVSIFFLLSVYYYCFVDCCLSLCAFFGVVGKGLSFVFFFRGPASGQPPKPLARHFPVR